MYKRAPRIYDTDGEEGQNNKEINEKEDILGLVQAKKRIKRGDQIKTMQKIQSLPTKFDFNDSKKYLKFPKKKT